MYKRFAIIQTAFIGDVALSLPLAQAVRNAIPDSVITFITTPVSAPLAACADAINDVKVFDKRGRHQGLAGIKLLADELRSNEIECVISPHRSLRSTLLASWMRPAFSVGFSTASWSFLYRKQTAYRFADHETQRAISLLGAIPGFVQPVRPPVPAMIILAKDVEIADDLWKKNGLGNGAAIAVAPGSAWATKRWPAAYYAEAAQKFRNAGFRVIALGGAEDRPLCDEMCAKTGATSFAGQTTLPQTLQLLKRCRALLTNDSAPAHLARLVGTPSLTVFGPTSTLFGFASQGESDRVIEYSGLSCRPCAIHGGRQCPLGTHECMNAILPQPVAEEVLSVVEK